MYGVSIYSSLALMLPNPISSEVRIVILLMINKSSFGTLVDVVIFLRVHGASITFRDYNHPLVSLEFTS